MYFGWNGGPLSSPDSYVDSQLRHVSWPVRNWRIYDMRRMAITDPALRKAIDRWLYGSRPPSFLAPAKPAPAPNLTPKVVLIEKPTSSEDGPVIWKEPVTWVIEPEPRPLPSWITDHPKPLDSFGVLGRVPESSPPVAKPPTKEDLIFRMLNDLAGFKKWVTDLHWQWGARHEIGRGLSPNSCPLAKYVRTKYANVKIMSDVFEVGGKRYYLPDGAKSFVAKVDSTYPRSLISTSQCLALLRE